MLLHIVAQHDCGMMRVMQSRSITLYGISNCDTVKKARLWLSEHGKAYRFHDFKTAGVPPAQLDLWLAALGWESVVNRKGQMWRKLDDAAKAAVVDAASSRALLLAQASIIKRPIVDWGGVGTGPFTVGFKEADWTKRLQVF